MDDFSQDNLRELLNTNAWPCVSIYLPTLRAGNDAQQGPIRLKNLLTQGEEKLVSRGVRPVEARELLKPAHELVENENFWKAQADGLAVVLTTDELRRWRVPLSFSELVTVGRRPCVKPLLPLVAPHERFFMLAVSQNGVHLYLGDRQHLAPVPLNTLPSGLAEALNYQTPQGLMQVLGAPSGGRGSQGTVFHGQSGEFGQHKDEILSWFHLIDRALSDYLQGEHAPLLFAGVEYLFPIYRRANTYPHLFEQAVHGNPDHWNTTELHRRAVELIAPSWKHALEIDCQRFENALGSRRVSSSIEDVLVAACEGRIEVLFVDRNLALWGRFDSQNSTVELVDEQAPVSEELLDRAVFETLKHRGRVHVVDSSEIPGGIALAALYRYEIPAPASEGSDK